MPDAPSTLPPRVKGSERLPDALGEGSRAVRRMESLTPPEYKDAPSGRSPFQAARKSGEPFGAGDWRGVFSKAGAVSGVSSGREIPFRDCVEEEPGHVAVRSGSHVSTVCISLCISREGSAERLLSRASESSCDSTCTRRRARSLITSSCSLPRGESGFTLGNRYPKR